MLKFDTLRERKKIVFKILPKPRDGGKNKMNMNTNTK